GVTGLDLSLIIRAVLPFLAVEFGVLMLVTYLPSVILVIPKFLGYF
ncbi:MAG: C4-dicarboxylate ABC transporter permease, partial [Deltaproteobacteria bacterium]|nr:C4-dicarboxylate ABC transporter permease [Deltaproteobacteria bacterium]